MNNAIFGKYYSAESIIHRMDPRAKLTYTLLFVIIAFCAGNYPSLGLLVIATIVFYAIAKIPVSIALKTVAPLSFIVIITVILNLLFVNGGTVYAHWACFTISSLGVHNAIFFGIRLTLLLFGVCLLTLTTTILDITDAFEAMLKPFTRIGLPAHELAMMMGIALRFLPQFADEFTTIRQAQLSRGSDLATSPLRGKLAGLKAAIVPLFVSVFRHAETLSLAMDARCYHGGPGRTKLHVMHAASRDYIAGLVLLIVMAATIALTVAL